MTNLSDPWRKEITNLKLKVAHGSYFDFIVLGYEQFENIAKNIKFSIVDGIIGEILSNRARDQILQQGFNPEDKGFSEEDFDNFPDYVQHEIIQDWILEVEVIAELENNPISLKCSRLRADPNVSKNIITTSYIPLSFPDISNEVDIIKRAQMWDSIKLFGIKCIIKTKELDEVVSSAWLPNFNTPRFTGYGLCREISELLALNRILELTENGCYK